MLEGDSLLGQASAAADAVESQELASLRHRLESAGFGVVETIDGYVVIRWDRACVCENLAALSRFERQVLGA